MENERRNARQARLEAYRQKQIRRNRRILFAVAIAVLLFLVLAVTAFVLLSGRSGSQGLGDSARAMDGSGAQAGEPTELEIRQRKAIKAGADPHDSDLVYLPTPLIAEYQGLKIHSPISANHITEIEFHQASYDTSLPLTPLITIIDAEEAADQRGTTHTLAEQQPTGNEPLIAEAVSTWRLDSFGDEMTAVDVGALTGTAVYAPISGTVVKIKAYSLYGLIDDFELHFQDPQHPELDIVVLHVDELTVKVGDTVIGGCTKIATIRNIGEVIDNNLANFTAPGDPGNHCHVQVNDAARTDYKGLEDALNIFG